ncbi:hypothetical protein KSS87_009402 [Heliosperma pusillum]|nr:hypothetical protein KSS87_009402 [Heliosperma pusillum]
MLIAINRPTFRRIIRNKSTEQFSGLPYIYTLLNCFICAWYGTPFVSVDNILLTTVNSIGAIFQLVYISLFITYAEREKKVVHHFRFSCQNVWEYYFVILDPVLILVFTGKNARYPENLFVTEKQECILHSRHILKLGALNQLVDSSLT